MRVISGSAKGIKLDTIKGLSTRPTIARIKESLFSTIHYLIEDSVVADFFSGSGSLCIEALSRGAKKAYFFEKNPKAMNMVKKNLEKTKLKEKSELFLGDYKKNINRIKEKIDILFIDPPHFQNLVYEGLNLVKEYDILKNNGIIVVEHNTKELFEEKIYCFKRIKSKVYSNTTISYYEVDDECNLSGEF